MVFASVVGLVLGLTAAAWPAGMAAEGPVDEYYRKLAELHPRDAEQAFQLSRWCEGQGLKKEAQKLLERTIEIDPDHAAARAALGYRRHGLGWRIGTEPESPRPAPETAGPAPASGGTAAPGQTPAPGQTTAPAAEAVPDPVAEKKAWAAAAAEKLSFAFNTFEDDDFLIHTTNDIPSAKMRALNAALKDIRTTIVRLVGVRSGTRIWPEKSQMFFFRTATECVQFSEVADGQRFPEQDGWYIKDGHLVFYRLEEEVLGRALGATALDRLGGSDRRVGWWLSEGIAELTAAMTDEGKKNQRYQSAYQLAATDLAQGGRQATINDLLATLEMNPRAAASSRARALTLVDFLYNTDRRRFARLIEELKSEKAPPPPATRADERDFFVRYFAFQEEQLIAIYRTEIEKLEQAWKDSVTKQSEAMKRRGGGRGAEPPKKTSRFGS